MSARRLVVVGDALLDRDLDGRVERLAPDAPVPVVDDPEQTTRPGGAGLAAALAAADGRRVTLVTALARDLPGRELAAVLAETGVEVVDLGLGGPTPEKVRVRADRRSLLRIDRGGGASGPIGSVTAEAEDAIRSAGTVLVSDYGRGLAGQPDVRSALAAAQAPIVWDPHPRGATPVPGAALATPNRSEAAHFAAGAPPGAPVEALAGWLAGSWRAGAVCVTMGARGAVLAAADRLPVRVPAPRAAGGDPCGAGDRFASRAAGLLLDGATPLEAVEAAVGAASAFVGAGGAAGRTFRTSEELDPRRAPGRRSPSELTAAVRAAGGTVVATGGCFDLLHAGHVSTLRAARSLGDCLVVCLNSDESVRRLKGPDRPLVPADDRAAVLEALGCVDAVVVFDEDTPEAVLRRLRPDVWAKGGDYTAAQLPEAPLVESWGGRVAVLPYVEGRSTTALLREMEVRGFA